MLRQTSRYRDNRERLAKRRGFISERHLRDYLAQKRGFASYTELRKELAKRRQSNPNNQALSELINTKLQELRKNQAWLARRVGLSRQSVSLYGQGKALPKDEKTMRKILSALGHIHKVDNANSIQVEAVPGCSGY